MDRIAVIGASSFSGRSFCDYIERNGLATLLRLSRPQYDLNQNPADIARAIRYFDADYVVNFAALNMVAESWKHYADYYRTNVIGVSRVIEQLIAAPLQMFIQVSTPEVYGAVGKELRPHTPYNPSTPYAVSRAAADMHLAAVHRAHGFPVCFTRTVNVYGKGQQLYRIIPKTVLSILQGVKLKLHGGGVSTRSFIHIDDVAKGILIVAQRGIPGHTYHMATKTQTSIRDLVGSICSLLSTTLEAATESDIERLGKDMAYQLDDTKIRGELGWRDEIPLSSGLEETVRWFREQYLLGAFSGQSIEYQHKA